MAFGKPSMSPSAVRMIFLVGTDGSTRRELVVAAPGDPARPLDQEALDHKAHCLLDRLSGRDGAAGLIDIAKRGLVDEAGCRALTGAFVQGFAAPGLNGGTA